MTTATATQVELPARIRRVLGKRVRFLRREGLTPAHLYGKGVDSLPLAVETPVLYRVLAQAGRSVPVSVRVDGDSQPRIAFVSGVQRDPVTSQVLHVDFYQVSLTEKVRMSVPIALTGEAPAAKMAGGVLVKALETLEVEALPLDLPRQVAVDVSKLEEMDQVIRVSDITLGPNVAVLTEASTVVARIHFAREEEVKPVEAAAAEGAAPAAEGAAPAEAGAKPAEAAKGEAPAKGGPSVKTEPPAKGEKK